MNCLAITRVRFVYLIDACVLRRKLNRRFHNKRSRRAPGYARNDSMRSAFMNELYDVHILDIIYLSLFDFAIILLIPSDKSLFLMIINTSKTYDVYIVDNIELNIYIMRNVNKNDRL